MLKELQEKRNNLLEEMEKQLEAAKMEKRALNKEELERRNVIKEELGNVDKTIKETEEAEERKEKVTIKLDDNNDIEKRAIIEERAFVSYIRGIVDTRVDVNLTVAANGAVIPTSIANKIIKKVIDICPIYQLATRYNVGGSLTIPYYDEATTKITMAYATEFTELESTSGKFLNITLTGFLAGVLSKVSKSLINNSQFDVGSFVINAMAESVSKWIENELLNGTATKVDGLTGVTQTITAGSGTVITADELIDVQDTVPDTHQAKSIWIMSKATRTAIRKLKDGQGNYLLNKDATSKWGYTLFGKDVYTSANMADMAINNTTIYYGDMSGLAVKVAETISIEVLREKYATQHAIGVVGWIEIDSKVEDAEKIAKLVMAAA